MIASIWHYMHSRGHLNEVYICEMRHVLRPCMVGAKIYPTPPYSEYWRALSCQESLAASTC